MNIASICTRDVVCATSDTTAAAAAKLMRQYHIGDVVVIGPGVVNGDRKPLGIVTDRDIVVAVIAAGLDPSAVTVGDIMGTELLTAGEEEDVFAVVQRMRGKGVRRVPIVAADGSLTGIVSTDDLVEVVAESMNQIVQIISREQAREHETRKS